MDVSSSKRLIFLIVTITIGIFLWNLSKNDENSKTLGTKSVTNSNKTLLKIGESKSTELNGEKKLSPLKQKIAIEKQKILDSKVSHENFVKARKDYLLKETQQRSKYLSYKATYQKASTQRVEQRLKSVKINKEKVYRQKYEQYNAAKRSQERSQVHKRTGLEKTRLKSLTNIQKKQLLYQKYKQGE